VGEPGGAMGPSILYGFMGKKWKKSTGKLMVYESFTLPKIRKIETGS
jgi:hypothetical protein